LRYPLNGALIIGMTKQTQDLDPYDELLEFFDDEVCEVAKHFNVSVQAIYQWKKYGVPIARERELRLLQRMQAASEGLK